ncbi:MAG: hypothetical protein RLZZ618_3 [Pseudomonadota bacterium]
MRVVTLSALSHELKAVEEQVGATLFERKSNPVVFTAPGHRLLQLAEEVLPQVAGAERDVTRLIDGAAGALRIAVECHTCFDWLMPAMDALRQRWPEVELDIVSGFQADPVGLLHQDRAELAIVSDMDQDEAGVVLHPLFEFEMVALLPKGHALLAKPWLEAGDFAGQTLITYPVPDDMLDLVKRVLRSAGVEPPRRTTELTVGMLQLVAQRARVRGVAAVGGHELPGSGLCGKPAYRPARAHGPVVCGGARSPGRAALCERLHPGDARNITAESAWGDLAVARRPVSLPPRLLGACRTWKASAANRPQRSIFHRLFVP